MVYMRAYKHTYTLRGHTELPTFKIVTTALFRRKNVEKIGQPLTSLFTLH